MTQLDTVIVERGHRLIPLVPFGLALSLFLALSYGLCILGYLVVPGLPIRHSTLALFLPGFELLTLRSFLFGLAESFLSGWYVTLVLVPLFNFFAVRLGQA